MMQETKENRALVKNGWTYIGISVWGHPKHGHASRCNALKFLPTLVEGADLQLLNACREACIEIALEYDVSGDVSIESIRSAALAARNANQILA